jgi:plasmid stabilization system protein ParE
MPARYDESEYVFCDLQAIYRYIRADDEPCARRFLEAAYDTFEFLADNPMIGRSVPSLGMRGSVRGGFKAFAVISSFTALKETACRSGAFCMAHAICITTSGRPRAISSPFTPFVSRL